MCRLGVAIQGWCNVECEDQLQHTITSHLNAEHASKLVDMEMIKGIAVLKNFTGTPDRLAAAYLHLVMAGMIDRYSAKQQHRKWFDTYGFEAEVKTKSLIASS